LVARLQRSESVPSRWGGPAAALVAILALAAALRAVGIQYGLPFALLNPDERSIVPLAWRIGHTHSPNPHGFFDYPTLVPELMAPFQAWQGSPSFLTGRIVVLVLALAAVAAAWWLGRRAYGSVAGAVAGAVVAVDATTVAYSRMAVTDIPLTLGVAVSLALTIGGQLELAGLAAGLAAGAKYPGAFLLVPLVLVGWRTPRRLVVGLALAAVAFLATSPYILVHPGQAWNDFARVQRLARLGWLGFERDHAAPIAFVDRLWNGLGPVLIIAGIGLVYALARRTRADLVLASFVLVYFLDLMTLRAHFDRYTLPLVAPLGALAGRMRALAPVTLLLLIVPLVWDVRADHRLTRTDTRVVAQRWIESHVPRGSLVAAESSTPPLPGLRVLPLALPGPGRTPDPNRNVARLRAQGVRYVLVTGAIADRVLAVRSRYPLETRFYAQLNRQRRVYRLDPGNRYAGPWVALYRLYP
jgi:4-amino-4-deoxy-L-arabinose transferase-like glycosyltransferase